MLSLNLTPLPIREKYGQENSEITTKKTRYIFSRERHSLFAFQLLP
jgi:hypothetical protein